jgi:ribosome biogenesis GTPase / thiamine phosphate phosphatase
MIAQAKMQPMPSPLPARLLSHFGRQAWALDATGQTRLCVYKGRDLQPTANDAVVLDIQASPAVITDILPRRNQVWRSEAHRAKVLAANVDQALIVIAGAPIFSDELLARMICACAAESIPGIIALNKSDMPQARELAQKQLAPFQRALNLLQWKVVHTCAQPNAIDIATLEPLLEGKATVIMGQSGMGKSSLLNALIPGLNAQTREISQALQTGKHTTTAGLVAQKNEATWLIDTPGFQRFGLNHLSESECALGFPEFAELQSAHGRCRFANCHHVNEPGCSVIAAVERGELAKRRLELWVATSPRSGSPQ